MESDSNRPESCAVCADLRARHEHALRLALALRERVRVAITPAVRRDFVTWRRGYRALAFQDRAHRVLTHG